MQTATRKCMHCRERAVSSVVLPKYEAELEHDGRKYPVAIADFQVLRCANCGAIVLDDAANERITEALRAAIGIMSPDTIKQHRETLGLTQKQVAAALQISEFTLSRWETGAQLQQRCMDTFLRAFFNVEELRRYLGIPGSYSSKITDALKSILGDLSISDMPYPSPGESWKPVIGAQRTPILAPASVPTSEVSKGLRLAG